MVSKARWEHACRISEQKPISVEPKKFRPKKPLFYVTEIDDDDDESDEETVDESTTTEQSEEKADMSVIRRANDSIERQARFIAEADFAEMERNWDKYMFEHMDENTAKFIILKHVHDGKRIKVFYFRSPFILETKKYF